MLKPELEKILLHAAGNPTANFSFEAPPQSEFGDYATNLPLVLAKERGISPIALAEEIAGKIKSPLVEKAEAAAPGFINIWLSKKALGAGIEGILANPRSYGGSLEGKGRTVIVEYFQLNIAKEPHVGHLRSAVIGDSVKRILRHVSYHAISDTHVGDWGTQFGILLSAFKRVGGNIKDVEENPFELLNKLYVEENERIEADPLLRKEAKEEFAKLERGDKENRAIWEWMVELSMKKLKESANSLQLLRFEEHKGESSYEADMPKIVEKALEKGVAIKKDGAVLVDLSDEELDEAVLIKSDGASTYLLRDLATIKHRKENWNFYKNIYVVDVRQSHHFRQVFRVAELLGLESPGESIHTEFGFMKLPEGAFSTRKGNTISLDALIREAEERALKVIEEKNPELKDKSEVAKDVALGAIKYFDLSHHRKSDIVFRWEDALSFEGNTGPYVQYTHARFASILRKFGEKMPKLAEVEFDEGERSLAVRLLCFPDAVKNAEKEYAPHIIAQYLFQLSQSANNFYHTHRVLDEADEEKKKLRILLVKAVTEVLKTGLYLLGIKAPDSM